MQTFYNMFYGMNPLGKIDYQKEAEQDLPALPDLSKYFSDLTIAGNPKKKVDPRFPDNNAQYSKQCFSNFAVWRRCLEVHAENMDANDPNAKICKKYHRLAYRTCMKIEYRAYMEQVAKDNWMWMIGLNKKRKGANPTVLVLDAEHHIMEVLDKADSDDRDYQIGTNFTKYQKFY